MSHPPSGPEAETPDGSRLCLECGICCQGAFHFGARVHDGEHDAVRALGLTITDSAEGPVFPLPCLLHVDNRCTAYADRPSACRSYQCKLLLRYLAGKVTWDDCVRRVELAKDLLVRVRQRMALGPTGNVWTQLKAFESDPQAIAADRELLMDALALLTVGNQHFLNQAKPTEVLGP
jgi:uncharacterized protein